MRLTISEGELADQLGQWTNGGGPLYATLADRLEQMIAEGMLAPGARLPAERRLAEALTVSRGTVVAAYDRLRDDDLVRTRHGSGTVVLDGNSPIHSPREAQVATLLRRNQILQGMLVDLGDDGIDLRGAYWVGIDDLPEDAFELHQADLDATGHGYFPAGLPALREALAHYLTTTFDLPTEPGEVIITTGAQQGISLVADLLLAPDDEVLVEELTYPTALDDFMTSGARIRWAPIRDRGADVSSFVSALRRHRPRLAYVIPSLHNPTGWTMPDHARRLLVEAARESETILVDDIAMAETAFDGSIATPLHRFDPDAPVLTIGSLSKLFWGGLRLGYVRGDEATLARLARLKASTDIGTPVASQIIGSRLLPRADAIRQQRLVERRRRYDVVTDILRRRIPDWSWEEPDGGLCLWVRMGRGDSAAFVPVAARHGVGIAPGVVSSTSEAHGEYLRLPFGHPPELLAEAVNRLADAWAEYTGQLDRCGRMSVLV